MIRPAATEVGIFLIPFAIYVLFLLASRSGVMAQTSWPLHVIGRLGLAALVLVVAGFFLLAHFSIGPTNSTYIPAHVENGKFVPGVDK